MYNIYYDRAEWINIPNWRHSNGTVISFGDGHVESWKWNNKEKTIDVAMHSYEVLMAAILDPGASIPPSRMIDQGDQSDNEDLRRAQMANWGGLGY